MLLIALNEKHLLTV